MQGNQPGAARPCACLLGVVSIARIGRQPRKSPSFEVPRLQGYNYKQGVVQTRDEMFPADWFEHMFGEDKVRARRQ